MKSILAVFAAVLMMGGLVACGGASIDDACSNMWKQCKDTDLQGTTEADFNAMCKAMVEEANSTDDEIQCVADANSCEAIDDC